MDASPRAFTLRNFEFVLLGCGSEAMVDAAVKPTLATAIAGLLSIGMPGSPTRMADDWSADRSRA
jgi:hypothetical protein